MDTILNKLYKRINYIDTLEIANENDEFLDMGNDILFGLKLNSILSDGSKLSYVNDNVEKLFSIYNDNKNNAFIRLKTSEFTYKLNTDNAEIVKQHLLHQLIDMYISYGRINKDYTLPVDDVLRFIEYHSRDCIKIINKANLSSEELYNIDKYYGMYRNSNIFIEYLPKFKFKVICFESIVPNTIMVYINSFKVMRNTLTEFAIIPTSINIYKNIFLIE